MSRNIGSYLAMATQVKYELCSGAQGMYTHMHAHTHAHAHAHAHAHTHTHTLLQVAGKWQQENNNFIPMFYCFIIPTFPI